MKITRTFITRTVTQVLVVAIVVVMGLGGTASALTPKQRQIMEAGVGYFNFETTQLCGAGLTGGATVTDQVAIVGSEDAERVYNFLVANGYKPFQAAGIMGNMQHESGIQPMRLQNTASGVKTPAESVGNRNTGWGLVQWTPASKFINTQNPIANANNIGNQLQFLVDQLNGKTDIPEKRAGDDLKATTTVEQAVLAFQGNRKAGGIYPGYERPANQSASVPQRTAAARGFLAKYGSTTPPTGTTPPPATEGTAPTGSSAATGCGTAPAGEVPGATGGTGLPAGDTMALARAISANPNISFQTKAGSDAFGPIITTGRQASCGGTAISPYLLQTILKLAESFKLVLGVFNAGHGCDSGYHPKGMAVDINGINPLDGSAGTGTNIRFDAAEKPIISAFYARTAAIMSANGGGGLGQINCFGQAIPRVPGFTYFSDSCNHIHLDTRGKF